MSAVGAARGPFVISRSSVQIRASAPAISVSYRGSLAQNFMPIGIRGPVADCAGSINIAHIHFVVNPWFGGRAPTQA